MRLITGDIEPLLERGESRHDKHRMILSERLCGAYKRQLDLTATVRAIGGYATMPSQGQELLGFRAAQARDDPPANRHGFLQMRCLGVSSLKTGPMWHIIAPGTK
jgi:hypothetical protein